MPSKRDFGDTVDDIINNPAYEMLGGYHIFLRRMLIPFFLFIIAMLLWVWTQNQIITAVLTGLMFGPVFGLERLIAERQIRKQSK
ncbi:MAG: hypothetical protein HN534_03260 [Euryarchaeota archaeon]|mgnify:FL=1|nr:hypothetical protein [Euryarchaeota archaeon]MBT3653933.1 hypothetical protein [Euryarchaeota archaeon]MBT3757337.1 hypothetical protein [Euryarchaeota archaeon]MBT4050118.1 hypothetical protein [Euryarchaeota archaeon]MBT4346728.1 hypothetical protein [Euryarchaeota archaeon]